VDRDLPTYFEITADWLTPQGLTMFFMNFLVTPELMAAAPA
jgi:hypothetical protein